MSARRVGMYRGPVRGVQEEGGEGGTQRDAVCTRRPLLHPPLYMLSPPSSC